MSLHDYQRKRDFAHTREPAADARATGGERSIFVVQLHHASRRHYDFRLQIGDVLKSWAVPKGPSFDPKDKRLAVEVEDHPLAYAEFTGDIDEGYGKGHVDRFDHGVWSTRGDVEAQLRKGHLRFSLFGERLRGEWHLVRSHRKERQPAWFLIKSEDAFAAEVEADDLLDATMRESTRKAAGRSGGARTAAARAPSRRRAPPGARKVARAPLLKRIKATAQARAAAIEADFFEPELARLYAHPPAGEEWLHEVKWDGYRILATIHDGAVSLWSRNGLSWTERLPEIVQAIAAMGLDSARFDGELIALDTTGRSDFNALQKTLSGERNAPLVYMMFDCPALEGYDLAHARLDDRKALLAHLLKDRPAPLAYSTHTAGHGDEVFRMAAEQALEGIMCKRADSTYRAGRSDEWRKVKRLQSDEFVVLGYTPPSGSRTGFGSLLLGRPAADGKPGWMYAGRVGSGFSDDDLAHIADTIATGGKPQPPVAVSDVDPLLRGARWVSPKAVVEVFFRGLGGNHLLRQASFKGLRPDKSAADLRDSDQPPQEARMAAATDASSATVAISHPDRVIYPDDAITKQDVADYYQAVMDWFLPGVRDRPTSVMRCPDGINATCFFQKHAIAGLKRVSLVPLGEESGKQADYLVPRDAAAVMELVQFGALEFHPWGALAGDPDDADRLVFDLDPAPDVGWDQVVAAARLVRRKLDQLGLQSFLRTTGGKGLHVVLPLNPATAWSTAKPFAHAFASSLAQAHPTEFVAVAAKAQRKGRIFLDYLRNSRGATSVASYSLRSRPGAPVAVPIRWEELGKISGGDHYTLRNTPARLARLRRDPWEGIDTLKQDLQQVLDTLAAEADD
ncbi:DNA ligase D [Dyella sp.]|jgi:bifunctional non-homologous end joining protein LigD|uniref:DNA ligase D n=1 Tax=Dyella sp. TaxID=1869338 RepID=UPI002D7829EF|nr:DNA ligase D [Dyella sp.]HET6433593.1 DNA ligase D [Dyella sp.]